VDHHETDHFESGEAPQDGHAPGVTTRSVDLERREDRFIIFVRDTGALIDALGKHTRLLEFPDTPVTRTVYFGDSARGLPPGLSIKARTYERDRLPGRWDLTADSRFELLELKRTVEVIQEGDSKDAPTFTRAKQPKTKGGRSNKKGKKKDELVEILRLSGSILSRTTFKTKQRKPRLTLSELLQLIGDPTSVRHEIEPELYIHLLETVHPLNDFRWRPVIGTEYKRTHFVTRDASLSDVFRATLDKRVTHYSYYPHTNGDYIGFPINTEGFSRFEVKADQERIADTELGAWLEDMVVKFRAFRIPSKKYRGMTLRSDYHVSRQGFRDELPGARLFAEFSSRPVRYRDHEHYVNLARYIQSSKTFHLYHEQPILLESHEHSVRGRSRGLDVLIAGDRFRCTRQPCLVQSKPVPIYRADGAWVSDMPLTSSDDLDVAIAAAKLKQRTTRYDRSRFFLVEHRSSGRVYKVGLERRLKDSDAPAYFVIIEYVGRSRGRPVFDEAPIVKDLSALYRFLRKDPFLKGG
jgi:hypothetical protein